MSTNASVAVVLVDDPMRTESVAVAGFLPPTAAAPEGATAPT